MITEEKKIEKICSFYASDYHLEMIMIPYINKKMEEKSNIQIITERDLNDTVKDVISNVNLNQNRKKEILNLCWNNGNAQGINDVSSSKEQVFFVVGSRNYIKKTNEEIDGKIFSSKTKVINCYSLEDVQENVTEITSQYTKILNTKEEKELNNN